jgi:hypothetical protein
MPIMNLAEEISHYLPAHSNGSTTTGAIGGATATTAVYGRCTPKIGASGWCLRKSAFKTIISLRNWPATTAP